VLCVVYAVVHTIRAVLEFTFGSVQISFCVFFCKSLVTVFLRTRANLDHFCFVFSVLVLSGLVFFQYRAERSTGKNVSEMTRGYFVSSGT